MTDTPDETTPVPQPVSSVPPFPPPSPPAPPQDETTGAKGNRRRVLLVGLGVIALVVVGVLFLQGRSGSSGGAASPEAAVHQLESAINAQDPAGAISVIDPGEVGTLNDLFNQTQARTRQAGFTASGRPVPAVSLQVVDLQIDVASLSPDVAKVSITQGSIKYSVDPNQLPDRLKGTTNVERRDGTIALRDLGYFTNNGRQRKPFIMAVRRGGRWFLSPSYTAAEVVADLNGLPAADFAATPPTTGADTPQNVLNNLARTVSAQDVDGTVALVSQKELSVLQAYSTGIRRLLRDNVTQLQISLDRVSSTPTDLGHGLTKLVIKDVAGSLSYIDNNYGNFHSSQFEFDGQCLDSISQSGGNRSTSCLPDSLGQLAGIKEIFVVVTKENGTFRLSPIATALEYGRELVASVDENVALRALNLEHLATSAGDIASGASTDARLNKGGFVRYRLQGKANQLVVVGADDPSIDARIVDAKGQENLFSICPSRCVTRLPSDGAYSVLYSRNDGAYEESTFRAFAQVVEPKQIDVPGALGASLSDTNPVASFTFAGAAGTAIRVQTSDIAELIDPDGSFLSCRGRSTCDKYLLPKTGTYTLFLASRSDRPSDVSGQIEPTTLSGFDGSDVTSVSYSSGSSGSAIATLTGNPVVITATPADLNDIVLSVSDPNGNLVGQADAGFSGGVESVSFTPAAPGDYTVYVRSFGGFGSATLTVSGN